MKFLDNLERMFARLNRLGIFFGACTAGFKAAHEYVQERTSKVINVDVNKQQDGGHIEHNN